MATDKVFVDTINEALHRDYRTLDGRPIYRIVWSDDQLEIRKGTFTDWCGHILIRQEHQAVRHVKKYWYFKTPCWVLEKLIFISASALHEMKDELLEVENGSYEPVFIFCRNSGELLEVSRPVVEFIVYTLQNPVHRDYRGLELLEEQEEVKYFEEQLGENERSPLFVFENSTFVSTNQDKFKREYVEKIERGE